MTLDDIYKIMPMCPQEWAEAVLFLCPENEINTVLRQAAFIAQIAHESTQCTHVQENLNYSAARLRAVFPARFATIDAAMPYDRNPEMIANFLYANRMGNGDTASGDGWKYRGRGAIQLTGKTNYLICGNAIGLDLQNSPDMLLDPQHGIRAALWFWNNHNLNKYADVQDMQTITKIINGGLNGLDDRLAYYNKALAVLRAA